MGKIHDVTLVDFVDAFIHHNTQIFLYKPTSGNPRTWELLWKSMDWQCTDEDYCLRRGFEVCPYKYNIVVGVNNTHREFLDEIAIEVSEAICVPKYIRNTLPSSSAESYYETVYVN